MCHIYIKYVYVYKHLSLLLQSLLTCLNFRLTLPLLYSKFRALSIEISENPSFYSFIFHL